MTLDPSFNLGHVITLAVTLIGAGIAWGVNNAKHQRTDERITESDRRNAEKFGELRAGQDRHDHRIRNTEQGHVALVTEIKGMAEMLREVRDAVLRRGA